MNSLNDSSSNIYNSYLSSRLSMFILFFLTKYSYSTIYVKVSLVLNDTSNIPKIWSNIISYLGSKYFDDIYLVWCLKETEFDSPYSISC